MSSSILEYITQTIYFDKDKYSKKEIDEATEIHKNPDPFIGFTKFPGTMEWKLEWVESSYGYLGREILFTFLWDKDDEFNLWLENEGISIEEESLSFIIVCNFMSIEIGDDFLDYENTYNPAISFEE
tara:strand:+ start:122 stop:502 length:381 start_codon:yes stop_codon:yes gene_type:complete